jgi:2-polyprenyl-3-methyl-5-hydroxy-6-metoxy-1,4-benzoquinol methylase
VLFKMNMYFVQPMRTTVTNKELLHYLKNLDFKAGFLDRLKVYYRPIVCPFAELIGTIRPGEKIGDIGCGSGQFALLLAEFAKPSYVFGIEINDRLVSNARTLFSAHAKVAFDFEKFDGVQFPEKIRELDVIFLNDVLHHVPKPNQEQFMTDLIAKMKKGARLVVKDINASSPLVYCNKMHDLIFAGEIGNELPFKKTIGLLQQNNLKILESQKKRMYVYPHYTIIAEKP